MVRRTKKPTKQADDYTFDEIQETATYRNLVATLPSLAECEAVRLTRVEIESRWTDLNRSKVNKLVASFRGKLAGLGIVGKTIKLVTVTDTHGNVYYDVTTEAGGRKHGLDELLPKGYLKRTVLALTD